MDDLEKIGYVAIALIMTVDLIQGHYVSAAVLALTTVVAYDLSRRYF